MPSDSFDHRRTTTAKPHHTTTTTTTAPPPPEPEHLPCPRCDSTNTKFCYYNNYNFSQPRHFCKACRRYWTHGGTLRDIPVGGGSRKNAKRSRLTTSSSNNHHNHSNNNSIIISPSMEFRHVATAAPMLLPFSGDHGGGGGGMHFFGEKGESFTSLLNCSSGQGGFFGLGFEDGNFGIGIGRGVWPFSGVGDCGGFTAVGGGGGGGNGWGVEGGEGGGGGECFTLPDLAISTPGMML